MKSKLLALPVLALVLAGFAPVAMAQDTPHKAPYGYYQTDDVPQSMQPTGE